MGEKKPTIRDVAQTAGVSVATVSRVMNGQHGFSQETRQAVLDATRALGYRRSETARPSRSADSRLIAIIVPVVTSSFFVSMMNSIVEAAERAGYLAVICNVGQYASHSREYIQMFAGRQVGGIIACSLPPQFNIDKQLHDTGIPTVLVNTVSYTCNIPYVKVDDFQAMYSATSFLLERKHRKIAIISGGIDDVVAGKPRLDGYRHALLQHGISPRKELEVMIEHFRFDDGKRGLRELVGRTRDFTGMVTCSDEVAAGVLSAAVELGIGIPNDLSVVGFDNTYVAEITTPALTSVAQPFAEMGQTALSMLSRQMNENRVSTSRIMPISIVERGSTRVLTAKEIG